MVDDRLYAVILAGGKGERFWPLSTAGRPKQFLSLFGDRTLLAQAVERLEGLVPPERVLVITSAALVDAAREAAPMLAAENIIGEPVGRDTAAAVALACAVVQSRRPDAVFAVLTADHVIGDLDRFRATLREGARLAEEQHALVTIGIAPAAPSTGFGYIETGDPVAVRDGIEFLRARRFVEKPDAATARNYVESGRHFWNAGMFVWTAATLMDQLRRHAPELAALAERLRAAAAGHRLTAALETEYPPLKKISIDYALMEKSDRILVARGAFAWDDVGSWSAMAAHLPGDADGNTVVGNAVLSDSRGNIVYARGRPVALLGVRDLIVVEAEGVTMICPRGRDADLKKLVQAVRDRGGMDDVL